ncbi:MAG: hypothetical protein Q9224_005486, partial [Gallowayella concinna]
MAQSPCFLPDALNYQAPNYQAPEELDAAQQSELLGTLLCPELSGSGLHDDEQSFEPTYKPPSMANSRAAYHWPLPETLATSAPDFYHEPTPGFVKVSPLSNLTTYQQSQPYQVMASGDAQQTSNQESDQCGSNAPAPSFHGGLEHSVPDEMFDNQAEPYELESSGLGILNFELLTPEPPSEFSTSDRSLVSELTSGEVAYELMSRELPHELSTSARDPRVRPVSYRYNFIDNDNASPQVSDTISPQDSASIHPDLYQRKNSQASLHFSPGSRRHSGLQHPGHIHSNQLSSRDNFQPRFDESLTPLKGNIPPLTPQQPLPPYAARSNSFRLAQGPASPLASPPHEKRRHHCQSTVPAPDPLLVDVNRSSALDNLQFSLSRRRQVMDQRPSQQLSDMLGSVGHVRSLWNHQARRPFVSMCTSFGSMPDYQQEHRLPSHDSTFVVPMSDSDFGMNFLEDQGPSVRS